MTPVRGAGISGTWKTALDDSDSPGWSGAGGHALWSDPPERTP